MCARCHPGQGHGADVSKAKAYLIGALVLAAVVGGLTKAGPAIMGCPSGTTPAARLAAVACKAGFKGGSLSVSVAVALAESGGRANAHCLNCVPGVREDSRGSWQVNCLAHRDWCRKDMYDLATNAKAAFAISHKGRNFTPWTTFTNGKYRTFLPAAKAAASVGRKVPQAPADLAGLMGAVDNFQIKLPKMLGSPPAQVIRGRSCPVPSASFTNDWHAQRVGHLHQGTDLFARSGSSIHAFEAGTVSRVGWDRLGGRIVWVTSGKGRAYYAHTSAVLVRTGQRVQAGQVIARVGNTGNARGTPSHLHFGWKPGRHGGWVNPYPSLRAVCKGRG